MSLLLEALKQAELRKREPEPPAHAPAPVPAPAPPRQEPAALELEIEGEAPPAKPAAPPLHAAPGTLAHGFALPGNAVAADSPPTAGPTRRLSRGVLGLLLLALLVSALLAWLALSSAPAAIAPAPPQGFPVTLPDGSGGAPPMIPTAEDPAPIVAATAAVPKASPAAPPPAAVDQPAARPAQPAPAVPAQAPAPSEPAVTVLQSQRASPLGAAYAALRRGELATAKSLYREVLGTEPTQIDALLGLATVAEWQGEWPAAAEYYRQALAQDPRNAFAWAGLSRLGSDAAGPAAESQLKSLLAEQPAAPLYFALGNLLAADSRWADAQAAYFEAFAAAPGQADYAFNLAVALEHLGQARAAADYYRRALSLAEGGSPPAFDTAALRSHLAGIETGQP